MCENERPTRQSKVIVLRAANSLPVVMRGHFRSRDKDGGQTNRSPIVENPLLHAKLVVLCCTEPELWAIEVYFVGIGILDVFGFCHLDLDPMTFIHMRTRPVLPGDKPDVQI